MRVKKLYVLAALEVDKFKKKTLEMNAQTMATGVPGGATRQPAATMQTTAAQTLAGGRVKRGTWGSGMVHQHTAGSCPLPPASRVSTAPHLHVIYVPWSLPPPSLPALPLQAS